MKSVLSAPTSTIVDQLRETLRKPLTSAGLREISRRSGVAQSHISAWLNGKDSALSLRAIQKIADTCGVTISVSA